MLASPEDGKSWEIMKQMSQISEDFYQSLGIPYKVPLAPAPAMPERPRARALRGMALTRPVAG